MKKGMVVGMALLLSAVVGMAAAALDRVAFICADMANESQSFSSKQFQKYGKDYGLDVTVLDAKGDVQAESQLVNNCIAQRMKAIFLNPNDINAIVPAVQEAKKAGIVVGMYSADLAPQYQQYRTFFCGVNDTMAGEEAAKTFIKKFPKGATIVEVGGQAGHDAQIKRHTGFNNTIKGTKIKVIDYKTPSAWSTSEAMSIMEDMIVRDGKKIQGVFCHWDNGATGVIEALKAANMNGMFLVAVDGCRAGFSQVRNGTQSVYIMQNFEVMAKTSMSLTRQALDGKKFNPVNFVKLDVVTKDNIDSFTPPEW